MAHGIVREAIQAAHVAPLPGYDLVSPAEAALRLAREDLNDIGNAARFVARHGRDVLFVREVGWHLWDGQRWKMDDGDMRVRLRAHETARAIMEEVEAVGKDDPDEWGGTAAQTEHRERLFKWARESGNRRRIEAILVEARPMISVAPTEMDADPMELNLLNGTLRLEGACDVLRPHAREDMLAKVAPVEFDPEAACPTFDAFLAQVQPVRENREFLQRWAGYCLTGDTREQKLVFNYGEGGNGKSVFMNLIAAIMGPYAVSLPFASLVRDDRKRGAEATPDLARLPGARMVRASEPERGSRLAEATVKALTGEEEITVRNLHKGFFDFDPQFKLTVSGNHKPVIRGQDRGIWRRFVLVPWTLNIPDDEADKALPEKLWAERAGVLNWLLDGTRLWLESGLMIPDSVRAATDRYRSESNPLGRFIADCVEPSRGDTVVAADMYGAFAAWCQANTENVWSMTAFGRALGERGFTKESLGGRVWYRDVRLVNVPEKAGKDAPPPSDEGDYGKRS